MRKEQLLNRLRDRSLPMESFREVTYRISCIIAEEKKKELTKDPILVVILRAGMALLPSFLESFPSSPVGFLGLARDETTAKANLYYEKMPRFENGHPILLLEPMVATGGSASLALQRLENKGVDSKRVTLLSFMAAPEGLSKLMKEYPSLSIEPIAIDEGLDAQKFIVPGMGDFGDRFFGNLS